MYDLVATEYPAVTDLSASSPSTPRLGSMLSPRPFTGVGISEASECLTDLNLDQVFTAMLSDQEDQLHPHVLRLCPDLETIRFRQTVFADLDSDGLAADLAEFHRQLTWVGGRVDVARKFHFVQFEHGYFLNAAIQYLQVVRRLGSQLSGRSLTSPALRSLSHYVDDYVAAPRFADLERRSAQIQGDLATVDYTVRIQGGKVTVDTYREQPDYGHEVVDTFERFRQSSSDSEAKHKGDARWMGVNHVESQILDRVALLFPEIFGRLASFCDEFADLIDPGLAEADRELQLYLAYLSYIEPIRRQGLSFCIPEVVEGKGLMYAKDTFDLALARKQSDADPVVPNDFELREPERIIVVSGPNQGGKTTFARMFGQLHYLAALGFLVPGSRARLSRPDAVFTHFGIEEDASDLHGRLEDDLIRAHQILQVATPHSVVVFNEIFTSTTVEDAQAMGHQVLSAMMDLELIGVYVTFVEELSTMSEAIVSMVSTVDPEDPSTRTFTILRREADGRTYAQALARRHGLTYEQLRERVSS